MKKNVSGRRPLNKEPNTKGPNKTSKTNKILITIVALLLVLGLGTYIFQKSYATETNETDDNQNVLFEDVGHYAFATAGSNLTSRGSSPSTAYSECEFILNYPTNWDTIKQNIPSDILSRINSMTGSYLNYEGNAKRGFLTTSFVNPNVILSHEDITEIPADSDALIIYPDGSYKVYESASNKTIEIEVEGKGWYYVSMLNNRKFPQQSWGLTVIYENDSLPYNYIKLISAVKTISNGDSQEIMFNSEYPYKSFINIYGLILGGGVLAWPVAGQTEDRAWAILADDSLYQLYDRGDGHFKGRTSTDFVNGSYSSQKSHNIDGGELDILEEKLTKDYFGGKNVKGLKFQKDGSDRYTAVLAGFSVEIAEYKITYNLDGGTVEGENPVTYKEESPDITLINPTKEGYVFLGWTGTGLNERTKNVTIPTGSIGNREYTAHWSKRKKIVYKTDGNGTVDKQSEEIGENEHPQGVTDTPNTGYKYLMSMCDKDVTLNNETVINKNTPITLEQIKTIKMKENLTCTVYHRNDIATTYKCD